jgi:pimeloyl-ACP methyl ester carboxylesterase
MVETYYVQEGEYLYILHNRFSVTKQTLLFVHGLGDSGLSFRPVFEDRRFDEFNLIVPDLIGYGRSSTAADPDGYTFNAHLRRLWQTIRNFDLSELILIGHSMGGDIAALLCQSDTDGVVKKYVNIEGALTQHDLFLSGKAAQAVEEGRFDEWFDQFVNETAWNWGKTPSGREYYASLRFCRKEAFRQNALEIVQRNTALPGTYRSRIGEIVCSLTIPKIFCYGTQSLPKETLAYVTERNIPTKAFENTGHCPHIDEAEEFYDFLWAFVTEG